MPPKCPTCDERLWRYEGDIYTCVNGHRSKVPDQVTIQPLILPLEPRARWHVPLVVVVAWVSGVGVSVLLDLLVR